MKEYTHERVIKVVGIDLAKRSFHVYGVDEDGQRVISLRGGAASQHAVRGGQKRGAARYPGDPPDARLVVERRTAQVNQIRVLMLIPRADPCRFYPRRQPADFGYWNDAARPATAP